MLQFYAASAPLRSSIARLSERLPEQTWLDLQQIPNGRIIFRAGAEINLNPEIWSQAPCSPILVKNHLDKIFQHQVRGNPVPVALWFDVPTGSLELVELVPAELEAMISLSDLAKKGEML